MYVDYDEHRLEVGYDLDGVIVSEKWPKIDFYVYTKAPWLWVRFKMISKCIFSPKGKFVIITGRPAVDKEWTEKWLKKNGVYPFDIYYAKHPRYGIPHKIETINKLGLTTFYESDLNQAVKIKEGCPNCMVIHVSSRVGLRGRTTILNKV